MFSILGGDFNAGYVSKSLPEDIDLSFLMTYREYDLVGAFFTGDAAVIKNRQSLFASIMKNPSLACFFEMLEENIKNMSECRRNAVDANPTSESVFYSFREFGFFTETIEAICRLGQDDVSSPLDPLYQKAKAIQEETWYQNAKLFTEKLDDDLKNIQSVTIGINLNAQLKPIEAGIVSVESKPIVTNGLFDKLFAPRIQDKSMICFAPIGIRDAKLSDSQGAALNIHLYCALNEIMKSSLKKIKNILTQQFLHASDFLLELENEVRFINIGIRYILQMQAKGLPVCNPEVSDRYLISDLYNPYLSKYMESGKIVRNRAFFDDVGRIHLVVGVNSGGKSVYMRSVGIAQILFQLGFPIPAKKAEMFVCDRVYTCFSSKIKDNVGGRLENECKQIAAICKSASEKSMILLDEIFSSTNSYDACLLARKITEWFSLRGCCVIYTTHIQNLIAQTGEINSASNVKSRVDTLVADYAGGNLTYKIDRKPYEFDSNSAEIFEKYGMGFLTKN